MLSVLVIAVVLGIVVIPAAKRLLDEPRIRVFAWLLLSMAALAPTYVAWKVLHPGVPVSSAKVSGLHDAATLDVPAGYALMVTAELSDESERVNSDKTAYSLHVSTDDWSRTFSGTMRRKGGGGPDVDVVNGQAISESGRRRQGRWGEDLQDRFELPVQGKVSIEVTNWEGSAASALDLEVVPAPPPAALIWHFRDALGLAHNPTRAATFQRVAVWLFVGLFGLIAVVYEVTGGPERLAADLGFLVAYAAFLRDGVTPLDDFQGLASAVLPAALIGWGCIGGLAWLILRAMHHTSSASKDEGDGDAPLVPTASRKARTGR